MTKFEYITIRVDYNSNAAGAAHSLEDAGKEGWELVSILPESPKAGILFLKRPIEN